ncbi:UvsY protein [Ochrobactrum phage vB_OspM_OC]|nr:UvsY protein [Ochrobactrum phage vB_OspM_OC]
MKLSEIMDAWDNDSEINEANIAVETLRVPKLHSKYLKIMTLEKLALKKLSSERDVLAEQLLQYFQGAIDGKDIGRPPFQLKITTQARAEKALLADKEYMDLSKQIGNQEEKLLFLKEVISQINMRSYNIKNYIEWKKWTNGGE